MKRLGTAALALLVLASTPSFGYPARTTGHWVGTWATSPIGRAPVPAGGSAPVAPGRALIVPNNQTLRQIVRASIAGTRVRVVLSNTFGTAPLAIGGANIALRAERPSLVPASSRSLTFGAGKAATIPAGAIVVSDPVDLAVPALAFLAVDLYLPDDLSTVPLTAHRGAYLTSYVSGKGNYAGASEMPVAATTSSWYFLARIEVSTDEPTAVVVAVGDSITDGTGSTVDASTRWTDRLARRLSERSKRSHVAVLNAGIGGNQLLTDSLPDFDMNLLARFDRDVLALAGVTHVVVLEGINDIGFARDNPLPRAEELIEAHRQVIERADAHGLKSIGATLTPYEGAAYFSAAGEAKRTALNTWIRTSRAYDGAVDFDKAVRDPGQPTRFLAAFELPDHLHPNDTGYAAMGDAIDLALFK